MDSVENSIFSTIWPLLTDEEWNQLENESFQNGIRVPLEPDHHKEAEVGEVRIQTVGTNSLGPGHPGPELEMVTEVKVDRVEGFGLDPPAPDEPEGNVDQYSGQNPQEPDDPGETEVGPCSIQAVGTNSLGPEHPDTNSIFASCLPLFTDKEWKRLENDFSDWHPLGPELEVVTKVSGDRVEGFSLDPPAADEPKGNVDRCFGPNPQEPDDYGETEVGQYSIQTVGTNSLGPEYPDTNSIFANCLPLFTDEEWNRLENEFSDLHPLGPDSEVENGVRDGVEGSGLNPPVQDQPGGNEDHISGQTPQGPDHPSVGKLVVQAVGTNSLGPEYPGKDGEGENLPERPEHASPGLAPEASSNHRKWRGRPPKRPELAPVLPIPPGSGYGRPSNSPGLAPLVPDAAGNLQNFPSEVENGVRDGVEGSGLNPPVQDQPGGNGDQISAQTPQESDHPRESEVGKLVVQAVGTNSLRPEYPGKDGEGENHPKRPEHAPPGLAPEASSNHRKRRGRPPKRPELAPVLPVPGSSCGPSKSSELAPVVPDAAGNLQNLPSEVENGVRDGVEGSGLNPPVQDQPGGNGDQISGQTPQEPDHPRDSEVGKLVVQAVGTNSLGPEYPGKDGEGENLAERPEHGPPGLAPEARSNHRKRRGRPPKRPELAPVLPVPGGSGGPSKSSELAPVVPDVAGNFQNLPSEVENGVRDGVEGPGLNPPVQDRPGGNGDQISGQTPQEPDHPRESEVGKLIVQAVGTNSLGLEYPGKDGEGENLPERPEHGPPGLASEASSNHRKRRGRPPKRPELAPVLPVPPRSGCGRPSKSPELAPVVPDAAGNLQNLPRQGSTQLSRHPKEMSVLPEGWSTEVKVRKEGRSAGHKDKTYIEESTKKRCRSLLDVWRYLDKKSKLE